MRKKTITSLFAVLLLSFTTAVSGCTMRHHKSAKDDPMPSYSSEISQQNSPGASGGKVSSDTSVQSAQQSEEDDDNPVPTAWRDNGIFSPYYEKAYLKMKEMSTEEKIGQVLLARCPEENYYETAEEYHLGGYMLFYNNYEGKNKDDVIRFTRTLTENRDIPMIIASDEEGGLVNRITGITELENREFLSPRELFDQGGLDAIKEDAIEKSLLLNDLGINTNLAPVCDICTGEDKFMYERSLGQSATVTSAFVSDFTHVSQSNGVSVTLKHFPGYGNNADTHTGIAIDKRPYETFLSTDFLPFKAGIDSGAHVVMVSHNIVECMDKDQPASLSPEVHRILREELGFTGIVITDDLEMGAIKKYSANDSAAVEALLAGNDMICMTNIEDSYQDIFSAVSSGRIEMDDLEHSVMRILAWKYAKGLLT